MEVAGTRPRTRWANSCGFGAGRKVSIPIAHRRATDAVARLTAKQATVALLASAGFGKVARHCPVIDTLRLRLRGQRMSAVLALA